jgi:hypothetical protein
MKAPMIKTNGFVIICDGCFFRAEAPNANSIEEARDHVETYFEWVSIWDKDYCSSCKKLKMEEMGIKG